MMRREYRARVLPITLTGSEGHHPVLCDIRLSRTVLGRVPIVNRKVWNLHALRSDPQRLDAFYATRNAMIQQ